jgi:alpha-ketoglutarate-dependent taurine dioxygenase
MTYFKKNGHETANDPSQAWPYAGVPDLGDDDSYRAWRDEKLARYERALDDLMVAVNNPADPSKDERAAVMARIGDTNMALYSLAPTLADDDAVGRTLLALTKSFGLEALEDHRSANQNGIVRIEIVQTDGRRGYIPYSDRPISWHTDGYYNYHGPTRCVQAMILHCTRAARTGGENRLLDHEIAWLRMRDHDLRALRLLMHPQAMTIPENVEDSGRVRPANTGPVFYLDGSGALGMRYSARKRFVSWRNEDTRKAADTLLGLIETEPLIRVVRLKPGQGLICNNVLHDRGSFADEPDCTRLIYRIRFYGRVKAQSRNISSPNAL